MCGALVALLAAFFAFLPPSAWAQGCVQCKTAAEAGGESGAATMNLAILVLLIPTVVIFVGIVLWAFRRSRGGEDPDEALADPHLRA